jgi:hypothetical protein
MLLLRTDFCELKHVIHLPDRLASLGLGSASVAALYALGHELETAAGGEQPIASEERLNVFLNLRDQPASADLPERPEFCDQMKSEIRSRVLGCAFDVTMPSDAPFVELGESVLAAIEATLATGLTRMMIAREPRFEIVIRQSEFCDAPFEFTVDADSACPRLTISCRRFDPDRLTADEQARIKERLIEMIATVVAYTVLPTRRRSLS